MSPTKHVLLSVLYFVLAIVVLLLLDFGFDYLIKRWLLPFFDWFNGLKTWVKIISLFFGGAAIASLVMKLPSVIASMLFMFMFSKLPTNGFTVVSSIALSWLNIIWWLYVIWWVLPSHYNFWIVIELLVLTSIAWIISCSVIPIKDEEETIIRKSSGALDSDL